MRTQSLICAALIAASCSRTSPCEDRIGALVMAHEFIKRDLKAPASATFPTIADDGVSSEPAIIGGACGFRVRTYVDAQNSFGATLRQTFVVTLKPSQDNSGNWYLGSITAQP